MAVYTVHIPKGADGARPAPERIVFLRDGFSVTAFLFGPLWLVWRRAWLAAALWAVFLALVAGAGSALGLSRPAIFVLEFAASVLLGFEGSRLVVWSLTRRGYAEAGVAVADSLDEAEEAFFNSWRPGAPQGAAAPSRGSGGGAAAGGHVVGGLIEEPRP